MRTFDTGATRDDDTTKPDYEGYLSPLVIVRFGEYMTKHRKQSDGNMRDSDNWQKGIPLAQYLKSLFRHFVDLWSIHRELRPFEFKVEDDDDIEEALCAIIFNASGYLHEYLKGKGNSLGDAIHAAMEGLTEAREPEGFSRYAKDGGHER